MIRLPAGFTPLCMIFIEISAIIACSIFGLFLIAIGVVAILGNKLPRAHVASRRVSLKQAPETVFDLIADYKTSPEWRPDVDQIKLRDDRDGKPVWTEIRKNGRMTMTIDECERPRRVVSRILDNHQFGGTWTYEVEPADGGCDLTITERGEIYNPIFRFLANRVFSLSSTIETYLTAVGKKFGEAVTPIVVDVPEEPGDPGDASDAAAPQSTDDAGL